MGFDVVDAIAKRYPAAKTLKAGKIKGQMKSVRVKSATVYLLKPDTFMNLSGQAVQAAAHYFKIDPRHIMVVCDDLDLPLGTIRFRPSGSSGGHNGLKSIEASLGSNAFGRLKIGVGNEALTDLKATKRTSAVPDFVLSAFAPEEKDHVEKVVQLSVDWCLKAIETFTFETMTLKI